MIVLDASAACEALLNEGPRAAILRERLGGISTDEIHVPELFDLEVTSVVRGHLRAAQLDPAGAEQALGDLLSLPSMRWRHGALVDRVWALRENLTPYDAAYAALAELLDARLLTVDAALGAAPGLNCEVERVVA